MVEEIAHRGGCAGLRAPSGSGPRGRGQSGVVGKVPFAGTDDGHPGFGGGQDDRANRKRGMSPGTGLTAA